MRSGISRHTVVALLTVTVTVVAVPWAAGWIPTERLPEWAAVAIAAVLASCLPVQRAAASDRGIMAPSFVPLFIALLMFRPYAAICAAVGAAATPAVTGRSTRPRQIVLDVVIAAASIEAAGLAYQAMAVIPSVFEWPLLGLPIAAAAAAFHLAQRILSEVLSPLVLRRPIDPTWPSRAVRGLSVYLLGAATAAVTVVVIDRRLWDIAPVVGIALVLAYRSYADYVCRLEEAHHRREIIDHLDQGMSVLDAHGQVTLWNDALERMLGCPAHRALGQRVAAALPALMRTELPKTIKDTLADGQPRVLNYVRVQRGAEGRVLHVKVLPVSNGLTLLWQDVTERAEGEEALRQSGERLALAAEGANDGLWQWNLQTQEFYVSGRWRAMIGLPPHAAIGASSEWLGRVYPDDLPGLNAALEAHLAGATPVFHHEHRILHEDGSYRRFLCRGVAVRGRNRKPDRIAGSLTDTTEQALAQERLRSVGFLDSLTGLCNRSVFVESIGRRLDECRRRGAGSFAVLYLDLDRFKIVNDSLGHMVGDQLLVAASRRLETCLRQGDSLARLGGDEFAIFLYGLNDDGQANAIAGRIQTALSAPFSIGGREVFTSASIGIAFGPAEYETPDEIMRDADTAMYHAKSRGKSRHEVFDADMHARVRDRLSLENDLRRAIAINDFEVHYQPIVSLNTGLCIGFESLVRWKRNGEPVSPVTFVPIAEELGLIDSIGTWVLQEACRTFAYWQRKYPGSGLDCITVNVSSRQLVQQNFPRIVQQTVRQTGIAPASLRVEITETALLDSPGEVALVLRELRDFGVKVYLDDFGTGYSSLSHLHKLPVDALKIDRSFVDSLLLPGRPAIVESILALARTLNTSVVAEGIESDVQAFELERLGCTHAQGFLFSKPLSMELAEAVVMACRPLGPKGLAASFAVN
jgi:diguanylate cyclase (GGDEF)-like protein/PAS domain S-box-containing protein